MTRADSGADYFAYVRSPSRWVVVSQRLQRLLIQDYAAAEKLRVGFYVAEIPSAGVFYNLEHLVLGKPPLRGFLFYSVEHVFPLGQGAPFLCRLLAAGYEARFALEEIVVAREEDIEPLWTLEAVKRTSDENAARIAGFVEQCAPLLDDRR